MTETAREKDEFDRKLDELADLHEDTRRYASDAFFAGGEYALDHASDARLAKHGLMRAKWADEKERVINMDDDGASQIIGGIVSKMTDEQLAEFGLSRAQEKTCHNTQGKDCPKFCCSACGHDAGEIATTDYDGDGYDIEYCPHCGAKIVG